MWLPASVHGEGNESGKRSQIDLLIDRRNGVIDLCEEKFASVLYSITKGCEFALPFVFSPYFADAYGGKGEQSDFIYYFM